jgi:hypothetical protein
MEQLSLDARETRDVTFTVGPRVFDEKLPLSFCHP